MRLRVKDLAISTGNPFIALMNHEDALKYDLHFADRIKITKGKNEIVAILDITDSHELLLPGQIGLFKEVYERIKTKDDDIVEVHIERKPKSIEYIKKKMNGEFLTENEMKTIVDDIVNASLNEVEMAYFVAASYMNDLSDNETVALTKAVINTGDILKLPDKIVVDKHCIGGVAGNRTTMVVVPIIAAAGLKIPKTSSRAITSAAGTSDTVEVLCDVSFSLDKMEAIVKKVGGCLMWGGSMNLAPADDAIIKVEHSMSIDPIGQLLASILAKKKSVSATHDLIDIPFGKGCKTDSMDRVNLLKKKFETIGKKIGMKVKVIVTDGSQPIGNGIGPALEARDVLWTLQGSDKAAIDLKEKSIELAGQIFEMVGKSKTGQGVVLARELMESGKAYKKFVEIIEAQNARVAYPEQIELAKYKLVIKSKKAGTIRHVDNKGINKTARFAGAPHDKQAGLYLHVHNNYKIKKNDPLVTIYADSKERLKHAEQFFDCSQPIVIETKKVFKSKSAGKNCKFNIKV